MVRVIGCLLLGLLFCLPVLAEVPVHPAEPLGAFIKTWLVCGPFAAPEGSGAAAANAHVAGFDTDYLAACGGEAVGRIDEGQAVAFDGGSVSWTRYMSADDALDLDAAVSKSDQVIAYACCDISADRDLACVLAIGTNDGGRVWLNGQELMDRAGGRALVEDDELIPVVLAKGLNRLLCKVDEHGNKWALCARLLPFDAPQIAQRLHLFRVESDAEGKASLRCMVASGMLGNAIDRAVVEAISTQCPGTVLSRMEWAGGTVQPLDIDATHYGEYTLRVVTTFKGGVEQTMEMPFTVGKKVDYTLFANGATDYRIVLGPEASESERWAAAELQHWLKEISGADFAIEDASGALPEKAIVLGFNEHAQKLLGVGVVAPADADESFVYQNAGPAILIWGGKDRGTMYGVLTFLERELGCRWYTPTVSVTPKKDSYAFNYLYHTEAPGIRVRNDFYFEAFEPIWAARNKVNGAMNHRVQPGGVESYWAVHTFFRFVPPDEFYTEHPEYYSLIDGKRVADNAQLCLTNPDVLRIVTERVKQTMRDLPEYLIYCVSQNDWRQPCQCDACQAIATREESESGPVVWFVNQVAEAVESEFPDKFIGTLAYQYTRKPCKTLEPRENVVIRLCSIECCFAHDFYHCPENESFIADMEGWAAIAPHIYVWDYVVNFSHYILPYPNFPVLQPNIQSFRANHAIGIMEQAAYQSRGGEFAELRAYVISKLLWNPECDVETVIDDFMYGYYGRSGQYVRQYFDLLHGRVTPDTHIHLGLRPDDKLFSDDFVREAETIFAKAQAVADTEDVRQRVDMASLPVLYLKCKRMPFEAKQDGTYARFCAISEREGVTYYAESGADHRKAFHEEVESAR
ncbi:MAG: hypothetical protein QG656_2133 [Candidatus Hydrogenedentes bacterium]|nr:hypothetical protein [Candidatus Hydrogenedentota bacterium]